MSPGRPLTHTAPRRRARNVASTQRKPGLHEVSLNKLSLQDAVRATSVMILGVTRAPFFTNILTEKINLTYLPVFQNYFG